MKTVLLIDDDEEFKFVLSEWLKMHKFDAISAGDGSEGVRLARLYQPDLIFCDMNMLLMNGIDVLRQVNHDLNLSQIPFFFLTSETKLEFEKIQQLGAKDVIPKSNIEKLRQVLTVAKNS